MTVLLNWGSWPLALLGGVLTDGIGYSAATRRRTAFPSLLRKKVGKTDLPPRLEDPDVVGCSRCRV